MTAAAAAAAAADVLIQHMATTVANDGAVNGQTVQRRRNTNRNALGRTIPVVQQCKALRNNVDTMST